VLELAQKEGIEYTRDITDSMIENVLKIKDDEK